MGFELGQLLAHQGYRIGLAARREASLIEQAAKLPEVVCVRGMDLARPDEALRSFNSMLETVAPIDFVYLCAGTGHLNPDLRWPLEEETIRVNALGFAALASAALSFFLQQGHGQLVGITSVAAVRGAAVAPAYGATKAFESHYLESLRLRARRSGRPIFVTEIRPGFVDTAMMKAERPFWVVSPALAARKIVAATEARKAIAYVPRRWRLVAGLLQLLPTAIYEKHS